jgi:hypothetical protein
MMNTFLTDWGLPVFGLAFAAVGLAWVYVASRRFDEKYGRGNHHLHPGE